jgi:hypothetical protein
MCYSAHIALHKLFESVIYVENSVNNLFAYPTLAQSLMRLSPSNSFSTPAMIFISVDLPLPLLPRTPILAPARTIRPVHNKTVC